MARVHVAKGVFAKDVDLEQRIRLALGLVEHELRNAMTKHPARTDSSHHHLAVTEEELHEARVAVYGDDFMKAKDEMVQVGAMALRYLIEAQEDHAGAA